MLTIKQVEKIARDDWEIVVKRGYHPEGNKGWCLPDKEEIRIYIPSIQDKADLAITLIHELIHVRNDSRVRAARRNRDDYVELEARETYRKFPEIFNFIAELYSLQF